MKALLYRTDFSHPVWKLVSLCTIATPCTEPEAEPTQESGVDEQFVHIDLVSSETPVEEDSVTNAETAAEEALAEVAQRASADATGKRVITSAQSEE